MDYFNLSIFEIADFSKHFLKRGAELNALFPSSMALAQQCYVKIISGQLRNHKQFVSAVPGNRVQQKGQAADTHSDNFLSRRSELGARIHPLAAGENAGTAAVPEAFLGRLRVAETSDQLLHGRIRELCVLLGTKPCPDPLQLSSVPGCRRSPPVPTPTAPGLLVLWGREGMEKCLRAVDLPADGTELGRATRNSDTSITARVWSRCCL